jgi:hypothetical protein
VSRVLFLVCQVFVLQGLLCDGCMLVVLLLCMLFMCASRWVHVSRLLCMCCVPLCAWQGWLVSFGV